MKHNPMLEQVLGIPAGLTESIIKQKEAVHFLLSTPEIYETKEIILTGCGDSHNAAVGAAMAFSKLAGVPVHAVTAMQASRYMAPVHISYPAKATLVLAISNSGETARPLEALEHYKEKGARTVAATCDADSRMGKAADKVLLLDKTTGGGPGVASYVKVQSALYLVAIRMAEVKGRITMDKAAELRNKLCQSEEILQEKLQTLRGPLTEFAALCEACGEVEFVGCGPGYASACFGAAKVLEATGMRAAACETEEFCHLNYFRTNPEQIPVVLLAPDGNAESRQKEVAQILSVLGRPFVTLDAGDMPELFSALILSVLAAYIAALLPGSYQQDYYRRHTDRWSGRGILDIRQSKVEKLEGKDACI